MQEEVGKILLNGMAVEFFLAMYGLAIAGVLVFFLRQVYSAMKYDIRTPTKFHFGTMLKMSALRMVIGLIVIAVSIIYFGEISKIVFQIQEPLQMNGAVAFMLGVGIDKLVDGMLGAGKEGGNFVLNKLKK
jgi:hypothetical protein